MEQLRCRNDNAFFRGGVRVKKYHLSFVHMYTLCAVALGEQNGLQHTKEKKKKKKSPENESGK